MNSELEMYRQLRTLQERGAPNPASKLDTIKNAINDKSGLGLLSGVGIAATLAYLAAKSKDHRLLRAAIRRKIPINKNVISPTLTLGLGGALGYGGKHFYDKYNKEDGYY